ncbi:uncharacterized protein LOC123294147 [Chrysoperla carnea]|uniref:uncharacterized protein LOC123294147 n=1 Tax=Chrysoperla carnea TaxID=189513 RepID=UPI001D067E64|nr:uncharacterized protein LOC123294147 [Chrysoperla carnea]
MYYFELQNIFWLFGFNFRIKKRFENQGFIRFSWLIFCLCNWVHFVNGYEYQKKLDDWNCDPKNIIGAVTSLDPNSNLGSGRKDEDSDIVNIKSYIFWLTWFGWFMGAVLCLGLLKGILGLLIPRIGIWGMDKITPHPHVLCEYREKSLNGRCVMHDDSGWPIHPDTFEKTVRVLSLPVEFLMNIIFFIAFPLIHVAKVFWLIGHCCKKQEPQDCYCEWVNTNCCDCNAETRHLLRRKKSKISNNFETNLASKSKNGVRKGRTQDNDVTAESDEPTSYDETHNDQENEDTKYVLNELSKSKLTLNNHPSNKFSILNERCDQHCPNSGQR